jgi:hypothetical protein
MAANKPGKEKLKTPYTKLRDAAKHNAETKHSTAAVQVRFGLMAIGIVLAIFFYNYPNFFQAEKKAMDQGKKFVHLLPNDPF